jgi:hypothetical protein
MELNGDVELEAQLAEGLVTEVTPVICDVCALVAGCPESSGGVMS